MFRFKTFLLFFLCLFSSLTLFSKEAVVIIATERDRKIVEFDGEWFVQPYMALQICYDLIMDEGSELTLNLTEKMNLNNDREEIEEELFFLHDNFTILSGDILQFSDLEGDGFSNDPKEYFVRLKVTIERTELSMKGLTNHWDFFFKEELQSHNISF